MLKYPNNPFKTVIASYWKTSLRPQNGCFKYWFYYRMNEWTCLKGPMSPDFRITLKSQKTYSIKVNSANHSFEWVDGSELSFEGWNDAVPSNSGPFNEENCTEINNIGWDDENCHHNNFSYVVARNWILKGKTESRICFIGKIEVLFQWPGFVNSPYLKLVY